MRGMMLSPVAQWISLLFRVCLMGPCALAFQYCCRDPAVTAGLITDIHVDHGQETGQKSVSWPSSALGGRSETQNSQQCLNEPRDRSSSRLTKRSVLQASERDRRAFNLNAMKHRIARSRIIVTGFPFFRRCKYYGSVQDCHPL